MIDRLHPAEQDSGLSFRPSAATEGSRHKPAAVRTKNSRPTLTPNAAQPPPLHSGGESGWGHSKTKPRSASIPAGNACSELTLSTVHPDRAQRAEGSHLTKLSKHQSLPANKDDKRSPTPSPAQRGRVGVGAKHQKQHNTPEHSLSRYNQTMTKHREPGWAVP